MATDDDGRVTVVAGVGPGLGQALVRRFGCEGHRVAMIARSHERVERLRDALDEAGMWTLPVGADLSDPASVAAAFAEVRDKLGPPDVLVYNAGAFQPGGLLELSPEDFDRCWRTMCFGAFLCAREVLPAMAERGRGTVLLTGATASLRGSARFAALAVGKFGLRALAQSMAREFGPRGVHVGHVLVDGQIDTPRIRSMMPDRAPETLLSPDAIAETYYQLHAQDPTAWTLELDLRPAVEKF